MEQTGTMLLGTEIGAALAALGALRPDVFGLNCATGPSEMHEHLRHLSANATMPHLVPAQHGPAVGGRRQDALRPHARGAGRVPDPVRHRAGRAGGRRLLRLHARAPAPAGGGGQGPDPGAARPPEPAPRSMFSAVPFHQDASFLIIGERTNANGSKKFRDTMLAGDWDACVQIARDQEREGAHVLDVCVDYVGRDGTVDMDELVSRFATQVTVPLVLDSTEPQVIEAGLQRLGGRAILNSANLEDGEGEGSRFDRVCPLAREYGAAVIVPAHRRGGPGPRRRVEDAGRPPHPRPGHRALRAGARAT